MVYKCCILECKTNLPNGPKGKLAEFPDDEELKQIWVRFVNRKNWKPTEYSRICLNHFDESFIKQGKKKRFLIRNLKPVPTIHTDTVSPPSLLSSVTCPRKLPQKRSAINDKLNKKLFQEDVIQSIDDFSDKNSPDGFSFNKLDDAAIYYRLVFESNVPQVKESIRINNELHVSLS